MIGETIITLGVFANTKAGKTLIEKISNAIGGICEPYQIKRVAKAEVEASIFKACGENLITDLERRAVFHRIEEDAKHQKNIEDIIIKALPNLKEDAKPENIENDWITNFFSKSRLVSDEQMQTVWARVLAGEANSPGKFSKRTVNFLDSLDKKEAELFNSLCSFIWLINNENTLLMIFEFFISL